MLSLRRSYLTEIGSLVNAPNIDLGESLVVFFDMNPFFEYIDYNMNLRYLSKPTC